METKQFLTNLTEEQIKHLIDELSSNEDTQLYLRARRGENNALLIDQLLLLLKQEGGK